jgi:hypothetical protein
VTVAVRESVPGAPLADPVVTGDRLFDLQLSFNLFPAMYAHPSWIWPTVLPHGEELHSPVTATTFWTRCLSSSLLRAWRLDALFDCDFFDPAKRLALIDAAELVRIGGLAGAVLMRDRLRYIVDRSEVEALRRGIGVEAHRFALKWSEGSHELARDVRARIVPFDGPLPGAETWAACSASLVSVAIPLTAPGVLGRLQLKFPRGWSQPPAPRLRLSEVERASLVTLLISIIRADAGHWAWLFQPDAGSMSC